MTIITLVLVVLFLILLASTVKQMNGTRTTSLGFGFALNFGTVRANMTTRRVILFRQAIKGVRGSKLIGLVGLSNDGRFKLFGRTDLLGGRKFSIGRKVLALAD